jgi:response regulator RpfG family c-di-GMP phosphodiesterase
MYPGQQPIEHGGCEVLNRSASPVPATHRVLIVDDESVIRGAIEETLRDQGYEVTTACDGLKALEYLNHQTFAVILSDQRMPRMMGLEFLSKAKTVQPDASRILMTAVLDLHTIVNAINTGEIFRFLVKPWLNEELVVTIKNAVQRYELVAANRQLQFSTQAMNEQLQKVNAILEEQLHRSAQCNLELEQANRSLQENLHRSVQLCLKTLETFYPTLGSHARRAHALCKSMARKLKLPDNERQTLEVSAWLHDIGLLGVSRDLIRCWHRQPDNCSEAELTLIRQHPIWGQELARFVDTLGLVGAVIRAHHERFDGMGYPDNLAGKQIPWLARLLAVAVAYAEDDGSKRHPAETVSSGLGSAFDPDAVRVLMECMPHDAMPRKEREVALVELTPGMVLAGGIYDANGIQLLSQDQELTAAAIAKLHTYRRVSAVNQFVQVYC